MGNLSIFLHNRKKTDLIKKKVLGGRVICAVYLEGTALVRLPAHRRGCTRGTCQTSAASPSSVCRTSETCKTKTSSQPNTQSLNLGNMCSSFSFAPCTSWEASCVQPCQGLQWGSPEISPPCWRHWKYLWPGIQMVLLSAKWISELLKFLLSFPHHFLGLSHFHSLSASYFFAKVASAAWPCPVTLLSGGLASLPSHQREASSLPPSPHSDFPTPSSMNRSGTHTSFKCLCFSLSHQKTIFLPPLCVI